MVLESIENGNNEFIALIKEKLPEGWYPLGGPFLGGKNWSFMLQAIVKYGDAL